VSHLIGYYVHHQGAGHRDRALAVARHAPDRTILLGTGLSGTSADFRCIELVDDRPGPGTQFAESDDRDVLHYVPLGHEGLRCRMAAVAKWVAEARPSLLIVDVSVEIAMLTRLLSTRYVYMRLGGLRQDAAHSQAFRAAQALVAPFHKDLDDSKTPGWVRTKTVYMPGLTAAVASKVVASDVILVANGAGGGMLDGASICLAADATPGLQWHVLGPALIPARVPRNVQFLGWVDDASARIASAGVVVGSAGDGVASAVLASGRPYVCLPQERPYDEQVSRARRLSDLGAAITLDRLPTAHEWPRILEHARRLDPAAALRLHRADGTRHFMNLLDTIASDPLWTV
jgi:predicted glycosyltransferase